MKTILAFLLNFGMMSVVFAQDSWKLVHNGKVCLENTQEVPEKNIFSVTAADLKRTGSLVITYTEAQKQAGWKRTIMLVDANDNELMQRDGNVVKLQNTTFRSLFKKAKIIKVYTMSVPTDPKQAALVRVRRVHLATITLKG